MTRQRLEDLGRLAELLENMSRHEAFDKLEDEESEFVRDMKEPLKASRLYILLNALEDRILDCWFLARWGDDDHENF